MATPKLSALELQIMDALWSKGPLSAREIQECFPEEGRPAFTTVQTMVYRLEKKLAVRRLKKISTANIFEAVVSRDAAQETLIDNFLKLFGGQAQPIMAHLIHTGKLTAEDIRAAERLLDELSARENRS
jgi:predicted transcriptional regulator